MVRPAHTNKAQNSNKHPFKEDPSFTEPFCLSHFRLTVDAVKYLRRFDLQRKKVYFGSALSLIGLGTLPTAHALHGVSMWPNKIVSLLPRGKERKGVLLVTLRPH